MRTAAVSIVFLLGVISVGIGGFCIGYTLDGPTACAVGDMRSYIDCLERLMPDTANDSEALAVYEHCTMQTVQGKLTKGEKNDQR